ILRILRGEAGTESGVCFNGNINGSDELSSRMTHMSLDKQSPTSQTYSINDSLSDGVQHVAEPADLSCVSSKTRIELSRLLDPALPGKDVLALAEKLGYSDLAGTLDTIRSGDTSPTTFLLEYFETDEGSISKLRDALLAIGRRDLAAMISP
ncbi:unnamed protein product, partial [Candidula unifasciata]